MPDAFHSASKRALHIYACIAEAMQAADEIGGPDDTRDYVALMRAIAKEAQRRAEVAQMDPRIERLLRRVGFEVADTGGGCTAWRAPIRCAEPNQDGYVLVTAGGDPTHLITKGQPICVGLYDSDGEHWIAATDHATVSGEV